MIALLANWRLVVIAALLAVPSLYAAVLKHQRDSAQSTIKEMVVEARLQNERTKAEIARQQSITKGVDDEHKKRINRLSADAQRLRVELREQASRSLVPALPDTPAGSDDPVACFERGTFNSELAGVSGMAGTRLRLACSRNSTRRR